MEEKEKPELIKQDLVYFWDNLNDDLYEKISDGRIEIRISKKVKKEFKSNCDNKGGMTKVLTAFINQVNRISDEHYRSIKRNSQGSRFKRV